jgi:hypothetical protein
MVRMMLVPMAASVTGRKFHSLWLRCRRDGAYLLFYGAAAWQPIGLANLRIAAARGSDISAAQESAVIRVAL